MDAKSSGCQAGKGHQDAVVTGFGIMIKINEKGVKFKSHIDGSIHEFTAENVMEIQRKIGADIIITYYALEIADILNKKSNELQ